jgi:hypothetical protein
MGFMFPSPLASPTSTSTDTSGSGTSGSSTSGSSTSGSGIRYTTPTVGMTDVSYSTFTKATLLSPR